MNAKLIQSLESAGVKFIRFTFCDNANVIRAKAVHLGILAENIDYPMSITPAQQALPVMYDAVVAESGLGPVGEVWSVPDWSTLSILPYAPTHARVVTDFCRFWSNLVIVSPQFPETGDRRCRRTGYSNQSCL